MKVLFLSLLIAQSAGAITVHDADKVSELVTDAILKNQETESTGVSVAIFNKKEMVFQKGFGYANADEKRPVTNKTVFAIGSTTKAFTSLSLKLLENKGLLKLNDRVIDHLSDFKLSNENITQQVTIEDLLSHQVGLPRHDLMWMLSDFSRDENYRRLQYLAFPENAEENFRKKFVYNNFMFTVAGKIIEAKTGDTYESFIENTLFKPIGMNDTFVTVPKNYSDLAEPHYKTLIVPHRDIKDMAPAGSFYSTSGDMAKWIQTFMNKKWENQDDLFRARIGLDNEKPDLDYGYGLAWMVNTIREDAHWYLHNGAIDGFSAYVLFSPQLDLGVVVLINQNGSGIADHLALALLKYEVAKLPVKKSFTKSTPLKLGGVDIALDLRHTSPSLLRENELSFENNGYGVIKTFSAEGKNYVDYYGNIWETKPFEHEYFTVMTDLILGGDHYDFPMRITTESVVAPFEREVPFLEFKPTAN